VQPARAHVSPRTRWGYRRRIRRGASGRSFVYNLRFPGQYADTETGLNYNMRRDYDPAVGRYVESDPIGLKAGVNTYAYVQDNPVSYSDPMGLENSTWGCDGNGGFIIINNDNNKCTAGCTQEHEQSHVQDAIAKFGSNACQNKPKGYQPNAAGGTYAYKWQTECKAFRVEKVCLLSLIKNCSSCKLAAQERLRSAEEGISYYCDTVPAHP